MQKSELIFIVESFLLRLLVLLLIILFAIKVVPLQHAFLGGGLGNYSDNPFSWAFANFDGEHYLAIGQNGYQPLTYFFFPLYPLIIKFVANFIGTSLFAYLKSGLLVSNLSLLIALIGFIKLIKLDYKNSISRIAIILLLIFPTSFFLNSIYTESLFLALSIWTFYFARRGNFIVAGILTAFAGATRVMGIALIPALLIELYIQRKSSLKLKNFLGLLISPLGTILYMFYLKGATGSYIEFFRSVSIFGEQRQSAFILLPQVFYRYFVKIIPNLTFDYFPVVFTTFLEISAAILFLLIIFYSFNKLRFSYWIFLTLGYLIPTFSGSFSSLPRYVLVLFPAYIIFAQVLLKSKFYLFVFGIISFILLIISFSLFARGYWIS